VSPLAAVVLVAATAIVVILACVGMHYEGLSHLSRRLSRSHGARRRRVLFAVLGAFVLHVAEIVLFGVAIWALLKASGTGSIAGVSTSHLLDAIYLSATTYSTLGIGDLAPVGAIRILLGTEALAGLMMITWSASFTYFEMERNWRER
jgi:Ion channel